MEKGRWTPWTPRTLWTPEEDQKLIDAVKIFGEGNWTLIAKEVGSRDNKQCWRRWTDCLNPDINKDPWTPEEDQTIRDFVGENGPTKWSKLAKMLPGRMDAQCRQRWFRHLDPYINKSPWTEEEDEKIVEYKAQYGSKWTLIANLLNTGRTDYAVKNRWNNSLSKRITKDHMGNLILKKSKKLTSQPSQPWAYIPSQIQQTQQLQMTYAQMPQPLQFTQPPQPQTTTTPETTTQTTNQLSSLYSANGEVDITFKHLLPPKKRWTHV